MRFDDWLGDRQPEARALGVALPPKYESDMSAFAGVLADEEIWAVLAYIMSSWPADIRKAQRELTLQSR